MDRLKDRVAVITGSGMGLGEAIALLFGQEGAKVVVADIDREAGEQTVECIREQGGEAVFVLADVSKAEDADRMIRTAVESFGRVDILVNNAGVQVERSVPDTTEEEWDFVLGVNLKGTYLCSKFAIQQMRTQGRGNVICISSISGLVGQPNQASYNASKHGVIGLVRAMACDHTKEGIRINAICPGSMNTPFTLKIPKEHLEPYYDKNLMGRFAEPMEVAHAALFLASDESSYVSGSAMVVDAGFTTM